MSNAQQESARNQVRQRRGGEALRDEILRAAADVFLEAGYEGASIDAVIARVGGSKRAIYSHFGGKKELFAAIMTEIAGQALAALAPQEVESHDLETTLLSFGRQVLDVIMSPPVVALYRVVVAEGTRFPELAKLYFDGGPGRASARLAEVLTAARSRGTVQTDDPARAAEHFIGMLRDDLHLKVVLGLRPPPEPDEVERSVRQAVAIFMRGVAAGA